MSESIDLRARHREYIQQRTEFVRGKRGPVSFVWGNHVEKPGQRVPGAPGLWSPLPGSEAGLLVEASASDKIVIDGRTVEGAAKLMADPKHPASVACFPNGAEGCIFTYDNKRYALQVWNPKSVWAQQFSHIEAFDWSADWVVKARIEAVTNGKTVGVAHHRNPIPVDRPVIAKMTFDVDGAEQTLYATRYQDKLNFHFTDGTSGHVSYGSGRAVRIPADQTGAVTIDFNYAALLPCSFSRAWNCPIPALENRLRVPIPAGERFAIDRDGVPML
jgi:uncharacterized protein (DUF1684 family)